jgi:hypothetical protein
VSIPRPPTYWRAWAFTIVFTAASVTLYQSLTRVHPWKTSALPAEGARGFVILKMPESPVDEHEQKAAARRLDLWLSALQQDGFHPMLFSEVLARLQHGGTLPRRTVVLLYDPGYLCTWDAVAPVYARHHVPAMWLTSHDALADADRRFLSYHALRQMQKTALWEVALFSGASSVSPGSRIYGWGPLQTGAWSLVDDRQGLNVYAGQKRFHRLHVNPEWSPRQLIDRLLSEVPVEGPAVLTARAIKGRSWGVALPAKSPHPDPSAAFSLEARRDQRGATLEWLGTRGIANVLLNLEASGLTGDLHLLLRSDTDAEENVHVGIGDNLIWLDQELGGRQTRLATCPWTRPAGKPVQVSVFLSGPKLILQVNRKPIFRLNALKPSRSGHGWIAINISHPLRGVAQVRALSLTMIPRGRYAEAN